MNNEFNLERAIAGEPIETGIGMAATFIAYAPTATPDQRVIVQINTGIMTYFEDGTYILGVSDDHHNLRMKSVVKQIDWAKLPVDTLLTIDLCKVKEERYFSSFSNGKVHFFLYGATSKTADSNLDVLTVKSSNVKIASDQPWTVWLGGECPIPDGLEFEYMIHDDPRQVMVGKESASAYLWQPKLIYAYRLTGKVLDGYSL
jgi:hypothetical protein